MTKAAVLEQIQERTSPEPDGVQNSHGNIWTSNERLRSDAVKPGTDYTKPGLGAILEDLREDGDIVTWHGLLAPATDEHLRAIIENEQESDITRRLIVGRCNELRSGGGEDGV